jgi:zinc transport system substrate-binding protein
VSLKSVLAVLLFVNLASVLMVNSAYSTSSINTTDGNTTLPQGSNTPDLDNNNGSKIKVVASFYPIYEFVKKVGGDKVDVSILIPVGVEPHDFEPTIQQIQEAENANIVIYNGAGLEEWIERINTKLRVDVSNGTRLLLNNNNTNELKANYDPHIWLDPILAQIEVRNIRDALIKVDPKNSQYYTDNAERFIRDLSTLDSEIRTSLSTCNKTDFIAFHNAFTYFADRYGLKQHTIKGPSPEGEVLPQRLVEVITLAKELDLHIIYSEDLVDPRSAETIAQEIPNGKVLILSPIEGVNKLEQEAGIGYLDKMRQNFKNLLEGLDCKMT